MRRLGLAGIALGTAACSLITEDTALLTSPGRFDGLRCAELAEQYQSMIRRERELVAMMERAAIDPAGGLVNWLVYSSPLASERSHLQRLHESAVLNGCDLATGRPLE